VAVIQAVYHTPTFCALPWRSRATSTGSAPTSPPAIVSVYLGEQLTKIVDAIESGKLTKTGKTFV